MRSIIPDKLWIGNARDLRDVPMVLSLGVLAVVDLAANEPPVIYPRDIVYCRLPLNDGAENNETFLRLAISTTRDLIRRHVPTLVACSAGMSRSPSIAAAALSIVARRPLDEVLAETALTGPHDVAPGLWVEVKRVAEELAAQRD